MMLSGTLLVVPAFPTGVPNSGITSGTSEPTYATVPQNAANGTAGYNLQITGDVYLQWYNGPQVADLPLDNQTGGVTSIAFSDEGSVTLTEPDASTAIPSGPLAGDFILYSYYSGDSNFAATAPFSAADFQTAVSGGGVTGDAIPVKFISAATVESHVGFLQEPQNAAVGDKLAPAVTVAAETEGGQTVTTSSSVISLTITGGDGTAVLGGTTTANAVDGIATFTDLTVSKPGTYYLTASSGTDSSSASQTFVISAGKLVFLKGPTNGTAGESLSPSIRVALEDAKGKIVSSDSSTVVTLSPIGFTGDATITGNSATLTNGIAIFSTVAIAQPGTYQLQAADGSDTEATSGKFKLSGSKLAFLTQPVGAATNDKISVRVAVKDAKGRINTSASTVIELQNLIALTGGGIGLASFVYPAYQTVSAGIATFVFSVPTPGSYTITAAAIDPSTVLDTGGYETDDTVTPATSKTFKILGSHLAFLTPTVTADVNSAVTLRVAIEGGNGKVDTSSTAAIQLENLQVINGSGGLGLAGFSYPVFQTVSAGVASFTVNLNTAGTYTLSAEALDLTQTDDDTGDHPADPDVTAATSKPIRILGLHLVVKSITAAAKANAPVTVHMAIEDSQNRVDTNSTAAIQLDDLQTLTGGGLGLAAFTYPTEQSASAGLATFTFTINTAGTYKISAEVVDLTTIDPDTGTFAVDSSITAATSRTFRIL